MTRADTSETFLVVGEALVDVVGGLRVPGGSPANVAVALGRLERPVTFATQLGNDEDGDLVRDHLEASGVQVVAAPAYRTSVARATVDVSGSATYEFEVAWEPDLGDLAGAYAVHVGSFSAVTGPAVRRLLDRSSGTVSYDINVRPALMPSSAAARVEAIVARADLVKASDEDLEWLYPDRTVEASAHALLEMGPAAVCVTRGAAGARLVTTDGSVDVAAVPVRVVDTIGAGDTFAAGLLHALGSEGCLGGRLAPGLDVWQRVGSFATWLAAQVAGRRGADPPWGAAYPVGTVRP